MVNKFKNAISNKEMQELFLKVKNGDRLARDRLIECNLRLVSYRVYDRFSSFSYDKDDLISIGIIGLIKAIDTFDISKNNKFATYAVRCIDNEILMSFRKEKREGESLKLDDELHSFDSDEYSTLIGIIRSNENLEDDYINENTKINNHKVIRDVLEKMDEQDRECLKMYFGFYGKTMKQKDIAIELGLSRSYVCRIILRAIKKIKNQLIIDNGYLIDKKEMLSKYTKNNMIEDTCYEINNEDVEMKSSSLKVEINNNLEEIFDIDNLLKLMNTYLFKTIMSDVISNEEGNMLLNLLNIDINFDGNFPFNRIEVIDMLRKILLIYKDRVNMYIDDINMILSDNMDSCKCR